jgi:alpha-beta hydrolase superfamily lysophospholipase
MKIEEQTIGILGHQLHKLTLHPETSPRGGLIFFHGQGDFIDRYPEILTPFVEAGFQCHLTDLPGHGRSPGKRGHIPHLDIVDQILSSSLEKIDGPVSIAGHSMGGLMTLRYLLTYPSQFQNAWISSPLLDPMHQAKPWMRMTLPFFAPIFPTLTVSTGVKREDCRGDTNQVTPSTPQLYHSRISLSWGQTLALVANQVKEQFPKLPTSTKLLFTQGIKDRICPPEILRERLIGITHPSITHQEITEALHEPFFGSTGMDLQKKVAHWLSHLVSLTQ